MLGWSRWLVAAAPGQDWKPEGGVIFAIRESFGYRLSPKWQGGKSKLGLQLKIKNYMKGRLVSKLKAPGCSCSIAVGAPLTTLPLTTRENAWAETRRAGFTAFLMKILAAQ